MRAACLLPGSLLFGVGLVLAAASAHAGAPNESPAVTVLRGSSAPPPVASPPTGAPATIVEREVVYAPYPTYLPPIFALPAFVTTTQVHGFRRPAPPATNIPNGWPLLGSGMHH